MSNKLVAIEGGGDWADASVRYLSIPSNINLKEAKEKWKEWYKTYKPGIDEYISFPQFLCEQYNAKDALDSEIEVFFDN